MFFILILFASLQLQAQEAGSDEPFSFIGMRLNELYERFGVPSTVFAIRGYEHWQDDVVFRYNEGDFYIFRDRVWQVRLTTINGVSLGDPKQAAILVFGSALEDRGDHILLHLVGRNWPLMLRMNINNSGNINAIYLYRSDY